MKGTLLRHPHNGTLVYSPDLWNDSTYAVQHENGRFAFSLASRSIAARFDSIPEHAGEYTEMKGEPLVLTHKFNNLPPFP